MQYCYQHIRCFVTLRVDRIQCHHSDSACIRYLDADITLIVVSLILLQLFCCCCELAGGLLLLLVINCNLRCVSSSGAANTNNGDDVAKREIDSFM